MDAFIIKTITKLVNGSPYQMVVMLAFAAIIIMYRFVRDKKTEHRDWTTDILTILSHPSCPAVSKDLLHDCLEARAFRLATNAFVSRKERALLTAIYSSHRDEISPVEIGVAMDHIKISGRKIGPNTYYYLVKAFVWFNYAFLPLMVLSLISAIFSHEYTISTFCLWAGLVVLGVMTTVSKDSIESTDNFISICRQYINNTHRPEAFSGS